MSKIIPEELVDSLSLIHDIIIGLVGENVKLFRGTVIRDSYDQEQTTYPSTPEVIIIFTKYDKIPFVNPGAYYDEDNLPLIARIKNADLVKQFDLLLIKLKTQANPTRKAKWMKYIVSDVDVKLAANIHVYGMYKLSPDHTPRNMWVTEDLMLGESFDDDTWLANWNLLSGTYNYDTLIKHDGLRSLEAIGNPGLNMQFMKLLDGVKFNAYTLFETGNELNLSFRKSNANNRYVLNAKLNLNGIDLDVRLTKYINGVATVLYTHTLLGATFDFTQWVNWTISTTYECDKDAVMINIIMNTPSSSLTIVDIAADTPYPVGAENDSYLELQGLNGLHIDGIINLQRLSFVP